MLTWMAYTIVMTAFVAAAAAAGEWIARVVGLPTRVVWCSALVASVTISVLSWRASGDTPLATLSVQPPRVAEAPATAVVARTDSARIASAANATQAIVSAWLGASALIVAYIAMTTTRLRRRQRIWRQVDLCGESVLITDGLGPAVVGFFRAVIALPAWVLNESNERRRLIVEHEREHLRAGDQRLLALAWLVAIALPWNLLALWMIARLRHAIEIDCDARVMRALPDVRTYGELLIDVSRRPATLPAGLTAFAERPTNVERRIMALTTGMPKHANVIAGGLTLAAAAAVFVACEIPRPVGPGARGPSASRSAPSTPREVAAPLPTGAATTIHTALARSFREINAKGTRNGEAVWFVADRQGRVVSSFVGGEFTNAEFRRVATQPRHDSLALVAFTAGMTAENGAPLQVVWATDVAPWEGAEFLPERFQNILRDSIRALQPSLYSNLPPGQAVYLALDWKTKRVDRMWAAPAIADRQGQWEYARAQFPERVLLRATNLNVTAENGRQIPVVYLNRTPWAERY